MRKGIIILFLTCIFVLVGCKKSGTTTTTTGAPTNLFDNPIIAKVFSGETFTEVTDSDLFYAYSFC